MQSFLAKIYTYKFFDDLVFIYPLYAVMFVDNGLTPLQISIILAVWSFTAFALEIPAGVIADRVSRKHLLIAAQLTRIIGYAVWLLFPSFWGFLIGFICWGIKSALTSGTFEALVYDELSTSNQSDQYTRVIGRTQGYGQMGIMLASIGAAGAIHFGYPLVLGLSILSLLTSIISLGLLSKVPRVSSVHEDTYWLQLQRGIRESFTNARIKNLIAFISLSLALGGAIDEYWSIFGQEMGLSLPAISIFIGAMSAALAIASIAAHRVRHLSNQTYYLLFTASGALLIASALVFKPFVVILLIIFSFITKLIETVFDGRLQHAIVTRERATIASVKGFFVEIGVTAVYFGVGAAANWSSYQLSLLGFGALIALIGTIYLVMSISNRQVEAGVQQ